MSNIVGHVVGFLQEGDQAKFSVLMLTDNGFSLQTDMFLPIGVLNQNVAQINADIKGAVQTYLAANHGITLVGGEKVMLLGGVV